MEGGEDCQIVFALRRGFGERPTKAGGGKAEEALEVRHTNCDTVVCLYGLDPAAKTQLSDCFA